jgi:acyl carrier protein
MNTPTELKDRVRTLMSDILAVDEASITDASTFEEFSVDSLTAAQILSAMEDEFGVVIEDEVIPTINSFASLVEIIAKAVDHA